MGSTRKSESPELAFGMTVELTNSGKIAVAEIAHALSKKALRDDEITIASEGGGFLVCSLSHGDGNPTLFRLNPQQWAWKK